MDAVTYPAKDVVKFVDNYFTPLRININEESIPENYHHIWTPTLAVLDPKGREFQRTIGFLGPEEFIATMHLAIAKIRLDAGQYDTTIIPLKSVLETFSQDGTVPEAIYYSGVVLYKGTNDPGKLKEAYEKLLRDYPDSVWTKLAAPYRLV